MLIDFQLNSYWKCKESVLAASEQIPFIFNQSSKFNLKSWAASEQFPFIFYWNLIENLWESVQGCLKADSFYFQFEFDWKSIRSCSGLPQSSFLWISIRHWLKLIGICSGLSQSRFLAFSIRIVLKINWKLRWAASEQIPFIFN